MFVWVHILLCFQVYYLSYNTHITYIKSPLTSVFHVFFLSLPSLAFLHIIMVIMVIIIILILILLLLTREVFPLPLTIENPPNKTFDYHRYRLLYSSSCFFSLLLLLLLCLLLCPFCSWCALSGSSSRTGTGKRSTPPGKPRAPRQL